MSLINNLSEEEILMVELLTYLDEDVANAAKDGKNETKLRTAKNSSAYVPSYFSELATNC